MNGYFGKEGHHLEVLLGWGGVVWGGVGSGCVVARLECSLGRIGMGLGTWSGAWGALGPEQNICPLSR